MTQLVTLKCHDCMSSFRIGHIEPTTAFLPYKYCPKCGSLRVGMMLDSDLDFWESMEQAFNMPRELLTMLYNLWLSEQPSKHTLFRTFVEEMQNDSVLS